MPATRAGKNVICPFFMCDSEAVIVCEGIVDIKGVQDIRTRLIFHSKKEKLEYLKAHCEKNKSECAYADMLMDIKYK